MKTRAFLFLLSIFPLYLHSQDQVIIQINTRDVLPEHETCFKKDVIEISSNYLILDYEYDSINDILYLSTEGKKKGFMKGSLTAVLLKDKKVLWSVPMNTPSERLLLVDNRLLITDNDNTRAIDRESGENKWKKPIRILSVLPDQKKLLATSSISSQDIDLVDVRSGRIEWQYYPETAIDTETILMAGDTALALLGRGVHYVSMQDGKGWSEKVKIRNAGYYSASHSGLMSAGMMGGLLGALIYTMVMNSADDIIKKKVGSEQSNLAMEYGAVYLATGAEAIRFDQNGNRVWVSSVNWGGVGIPTIFIKGDNLFIVDDGIEYTSNGPINTIPRVMRIDKHTGDILATTTHSADKNEYIIDYLMLENSLIVIGNSRIVELNIESLMPIVNKVYGSSTSSFGLRRIISSPGYVKNENRFKFLSDSSDDSILFENTGRGKILFDRQMEILEAIPKTRYFDISDDFGDKLHISNPISSYIITSEGEILAKLNDSPGSKFVGRHYFVQQGSKLEMMSLK